MMNSTEQAVDFLGHQINCVQDADGTPYVPLKRLCEILGIDHNRQRKEIKNSGVFHWKIVSVKGGDWRHRKMLCLPSEVVGDWASTIDSTTVRPEVVEALTNLLEKSDEAVEEREAREATANPGMIEVTPEANKKEQAYNCLGNASWFLDAFLIWVGEMIKYGDYFPRDHVRKASRAEVQDFVRRVRCNVRVMQAIVNAGLRYQELDDGINEQGLTELHNEVWNLYESIEALIQEPPGSHFDSVAAHHPALEYLAGPGFEAMSHAGFEMQRDFHETIIPPAEG
jgi:hypothetical protein